MPGHKKGSEATIDSLIRFRPRGAMSGVPIALAASDYCLYRRSGLQDIEAEGSKMNRRGLSPLRAPTMCRAGKVGKPSGRRINLLR